MSIFDGYGNNSNRIIKLFNFDDNKFTMELKLKIETQQALLRKQKAYHEELLINLTAVQNNIIVLYRAIDFLKSDEAKIVLMSEYETYKQSLPKLLKDEVAINNEITAVTKMITDITNYIAEMESSVDRLKTKVLKFGRKNET